MNVKCSLENQTILQDALTELRRVRTRLETLECVPPEEVQDSYESIIDTLLTIIGISDKQKDLLWELATPEN